MIIGLDIDGVITKKDWSTQLPDVFSYATYIAQIVVPRIIRSYILNADVQQGLEEFSRACVGHEIVIITARPKFVEEETRQWLAQNLTIPIKSLHCVGLTPGIAKRKYDIAQQENVELFIDNRSRTVEFFLQHEIRAIRFTSWQDIPLQKIC